jgi:hypothetical protein
MKQNIRIVADDGDTKTTIRAVIAHRNKRAGHDEGLSADEQRGIKRTMQRRLADSVRGITYTNYGPENTKVSK